MGTDFERVIIEQLSEIQRTVGMTVASLEAVKEEVKTQGLEANDHRENIKSSMNNALARVGQLEHELRSVKQTLEKTVAPLIKEGEAAKNKIVGFGMAMGIVTSALGVLWWFLFGGGIQTLLKALGINTAL
jgi:DNA-binding transcriptional regulator YbjK